MEAQAMMEHLSHDADRMMTAAGRALGRPVERMDVLYDDQAGGFLLCCDSVDDVLVWLDAQTGDWQAEVPAMVDCPESWRAVYQFDGWRLEYELGEYSMTWDVMEGE